MNRRAFLRSASIMSASVALSKMTPLLAETSGALGWRTSDVTTRAEVLKPSGTTRVWLPAALITDTPFQKTLSNRFYAEGGAVRMVESRADGLGIISAEFPAGIRPVITVTSRVATRN